MWYISSWAVGLALLTICILTLLWGLDLVATELILKRYTTYKNRYRNGSLWLGLYFIISGIIIYGVLGYTLVRSTEPVPLWAAIPVILAGITAGLAWYFLSRERELTLEGESDDLV